QKTILDASERRVVATDLTGPASLVRLIEKTEGSTVALLRAEELVALQKRYSTGDGDLILRREHSPMSLKWEERRLFRAMLRGEDELQVRIEGPSAPFGTLPE
ncbi:MAG: MGDG synthase family glycosyltransferase, partial [Glutamicibacter ardleyensis]